MKLTCILPLVAASLLGTATAQGTEAGIPAATVDVGRQSSSTPARSPQVLDDLFSAPIRSGQDDSGHRYGTWASGPRYKVSFHDGMAFYPVLGMRYPHNLPVAWATASVTVGGLELMSADEVARHTCSDWRYEYRHRAITEAYDVLSTGVEQTFTIDRRPAARGDLVIHGTVTTELVADTRGFAHGPLVFRHSDGTEIVHYGEAFAVDAAGDRQPVEAAYDGERISLLVPAAWIDRAVFPVVVDPLLGNVLVSYDPTNRWSSWTNIARDDVADDLMIVYGRANSTTDSDLYARITEDDFSSSRLVWTDVSASWSSYRSDVAFVGGPARWILVVQRLFPGTTGSLIRYHVRDSGDYAPSTTWHALAGATGGWLTHPQVGGTIAGSSGDSALVVYQSDVGLSNSTTSEIYAHLVDVRTRTVGPAIDLEPGAGLDRESPVVNSESAGGTASWICCWCQLNNTINEDDWDLRARRVRFDGSDGGHSTLGDVSATAHAFQPRVAGRSGRYAVVYGEAGNPTGRELNAWAPHVRAQRFDWSESSSTPSPQPPRSIRSSSVDAFWPGAIAYDDTTRSHWALVYHSRSWDVFAARIGYDAGLCEAVTVYDTADIASTPSITFNDDDAEFPLVFAARETGAQPQPVYGDRFDYPAFSRPSSYGRGCGPATLTSNADTHAHKPHSGQEFFSLQASTTPSNTPGALNIALGRAAIAIPFLRGCTMNTAAPIISLPMNASGTSARLPLPIPGGLRGDLYLQYVYVDRSSPNSIPVSTSNGLLVVIR